MSDSRQVDNGGVVQDSFTFQKDIPNPPQEREKRRGPSVPQEIQNSFGRYMTELHAVRVDQEALFAVTPSYKKEELWRGYYRYHAVEDRGRKAVDFSEASSISLDSSAEFGRSVSILRRGEDPYKIETAVSFSLEPDKKGAFFRTLPLEELEISWDDKTGEIRHVDYKPNEIGEYGKIVYKGGTYVGAELIKRLEDGSKDVYEDNDNENRYETAYDPITGTIVIQRYTGDKLRDTIKIPNRLDKQRVVERLVNLSLLKDFINAPCENDEWLQESLPDVFGIKWTRHADLEAFANTSKR